MPLEISVAPPASPPVVCVVDDDPLHRRMSVRVLRLHGYTVRDFPSAAAFLDDLTEGSARDEPPGCVVLDLFMPDMSGLELQEALARRGITLSLLFYTGYGDVPSSVRAMKAGAVDFLVKPVEASDLLEAVRRAVARDVTDRAVRQRRAELCARVAALSEREQEVFLLVIAGKLNKQIAEQLGIAERTVKAHRSHIQEKLGVDSVAGMVHLADEIDIFPRADVESSLTPSLPPL